jgi:hypothetical protein
VESPWERIRALKAHVETPLGLALRGRFLVGSRPVDNDFIRRFIACAAENGIDVFRLHDPLNDVSNLREAADAVARAGGEFEAGLVYSPGRTGENDPLMEQARELPNLGAVRVLLHARPARCSHIALPGRVYGGDRSSGRYLLPGLRRQRTGRGARGRSCRSRPDRICRLSIALTFAPRIRRGARRGAYGARLDCDIDVSALWEASDVVDEPIGGDR